MIIILYCLQLDQLVYNKINKLVMLKNIQDIYASCYNKSLLFAKSYVHDEMVSEDIVSDSIIKLWQLMKSEVVEKPEALLMTIIRNKALDYLKHQSISISVKQNIEDQHQRELNLRILSLKACDPNDIFSSEIMEIIDSAMLQLPKQTQAIFNFSRFDNLSQKEIAEKTGLSTKSVEYHINKSLKLLRVKLADYLSILLF